MEARKRFENGAYIKIKTHSTRLPDVLTRDIWRHYARRFDDRGF